MTPQRYLADYLFGALAPAERAEFERQLASDPTLRHELRELREALTAITSALPGSAPRAAARASLLAALPALDGERAALAARAAGARSPHLSSDMALIVAALDERDTEHCAGWAHAQQCEACTGRIRDSQASLRAIAVESAVPELRERILSSATLAVRAVRGRRTPWLIAFGLCLSVLWALFDGRAQSGLFPAKGLHCIFWENVAAILPLLAAGAWAVRTRQAPDPLRLTAVGLFGGLLGQAWLHFRCVTSHAGLHLLCFHVTGVFVAALLGQLSGRLARRLWWQTR